MLERRRLVLDIVRVVSKQKIIQRCHSMVQSENNAEDKQAVLKNIAKSLYKIGHLSRLADMKTSENVYHHFAEPTEIINIEPEKYKDKLKDFLEIDEATQNFGSPEICDQMSGAIYLHANIAEDKCSQSLRLASDVIPEMSVHELMICLARINYWSSQTSKSLALKEVTKSLDDACTDRLNSQFFILRDQLRMAYQWQSLMFQHNPRFTSEMLGSVTSSSLLQSSLPVLVSWLLLVSSLNTPLEQDRSSLAESVSEQLRMTGSLSLMSESEIVSCYRGLKALKPGVEVKLGEVLQNNFG